MSDRTLVLLKPDAVERKLVGSIVSRFESKNLDVVAMELRQLDAATLERHYEEQSRSNHDGSNQSSYGCSWNNSRRSGHLVHRESRARQRLT